MADQYNEDQAKSIARHIKSSTREITILFTDIKDSTKQWDKKGDVNGRLMVDRHNRLLFPVVKKYSGKVIKTMGDSIMASFKNPADAIKCAVGMQQMLAKERKQSEKFKDLQIRIGVHTGPAIVEDNDVYGDAVNIAARIESDCKENQIQVSGDTAAKVGKKEFALNFKGRFTPKGKDKPVDVFLCDWTKAKSMIDKIKTTQFLPVIPKQKKQLGLYLLISIAMVLFLFIKYIRFFIVESDFRAYLTYDPVIIFTQHPITATLEILFWLSIPAYLYWKKTLPIWMMRLLRGGMGFSLAFFIVYLPLTLIPIDMLPASLAGLFNKPVYQSKNLIVEIVSDTANIRNKPSLRSKITHQRSKGDLLLMVDYKKRGKWVWNKVKIDRKNEGWVVRVIPPKMGVPAQRVSLTNKFYFFNKDLYAVLFGFLGFIGGFITFRIRPA